MYKIQPEGSKARGEVFEKFLLKSFCGKKKVFFPFLVFNYQNFVLSGPEEAARRVKGNAEWAKYGY